MTFDILYITEDDDRVRAIQALLKMEDMNYRLIISPENLKYSNGINEVIIKHREDVIIGFYNLVDYIKEKGFCLC